MSQPNVPDRWQKAVRKQPKPMSVSLWTWTCQVRAGGTEETPVGTVFMGCYCAGKTTVREFHFEGDRKSIRDQAVDQALTFICDRLRKYDR